MTGSLVVVATPIGNLGDLSTRARDTLTTADVIFCEDTRVTRKLLSAIGAASQGRLYALHQHNEAAQCADVVRRIEAGQTVALVSDAGTPGVSDPGTRVVAAVREAALPVTSVPGASAVVAALVLSGLSTDRFCFEGFAPRDAAGRDALRAQLLVEPRTTVLYESPNRLAPLLDHLAVTLGERPAAVCRELTKLHEEVVRDTIAGLATWANAREVRGECVVVIEGAPPAPPVDDAVLHDAIGRELRRGSSVRDAADHAVRELGVAHRRAYTAALSHPDRRE